jgi:hypothetical protein
MALLDLKKNDPRIWRLIDDVHRLRAATPRARFASEPKHRELMTLPGGQPAEAPREGLGTVPDRAVQCR